MITFVRNLFTKNIALKLLSLGLALVLWFYIVKELNRGSEEDRRFLTSLLPSEGMISKKLVIRPIFVGRIRDGYVVTNDKIVIAPDYCIVVGARDLLNKIRYAYTMPIDISGVNKTFTKSVPLNPIAPGIFMEDTLVQITVPIEKAEQG